MANYSIKARYYTPLINLKVDKNLISDLLQHEHTQSRVVRLLCNLFIAKTSHEDDHVLIEYFQSEILSIFTEDIPSDSFEILKETYESIVGGPHIKLRKVILEKIFNLSTTNEQKAFVLM